jgi:hypothetical protein
MVTVDDRRRTLAVAWLEKDVKHLKGSTPIVVFAHIRLWSVYTEWGWGTEDGGQRTRTTATGKPS